MHNMFNERAADLIARANAPKSHPGMSRAAIVGIVLLVLILLAAVAWLVLRQLRARRLGLPTSYNPFGGSSASRNNYSSTPSSGPLGWVKDRLSGLRNSRHRTAGGAYEEPLGGGSVGGRRSGRGFGPLDPDEAWDTRVAVEADGYGPGGYYEEQELEGGGPDPYGGQPADDIPRGRSRDPPSVFIGGSQRGLDERYEEEMGHSEVENPFDDQAEPSQMPLRQLSPRPSNAEGAGT